MDVERSMRAIVDELERHTKHFNQLSRLLRAHTLHNILSGMLIHEQERNSDLTYAQVEKTHDLVTAMLWWGGSLIPVIIVVTCENTGTLITLYYGSHTVEVKA